MADELDVDAELLAMAGDSSDDDADEGDTSEQARPQTPNDNVRTSRETVTEPPPSARRGVAQKVRKRGGRRKVSRREIEDELLDLGDDSSSPPASLGVGAMLASDSEADAPASPDSDDGPPYPLEGKFVSTSDKQHILSLPEIEREEILAERAQEQLKRQQDVQLKKALAATQAAANKHKRKAAAADLEDGMRKTSRPRTERTARSALDDYKKAREAKGAERTGRLDVQRDRREERSPSAASDRDADAESEVEWAEPSSRAMRDRAEPIAEMKDFERCRIGRTNFAKVCFYPRFEDTIRGCFARVSIGLNRETSQNMYRMAQIKGFTEGKPYLLESSNGKSFMTDQYALVAHGSVEKPWPFSACSDSKFAADEFERYKDALEKDRVRLPRKLWLEQKLDDIHRFLNVEWTDTVLQEKFARQRAMERKLDPANATHRRRTEITQRRAEAQENDDAEEVLKCDAELAALMNNVAATNGSHGLAGRGKQSPVVKIAAQQERLALLNQKNRGKNAEDVRKALLEERRKIQREREKALAEAKANVEAETEKKRAESTLLSVPKGDMSELFGDTPNMSRAGTPFSGTSTPRRRAGTPISGFGGPKRERSGVGFGKKKLEDDVLDLGIDVEL